MIIVKKSQELIFVFLLKVNDPVDSINFTELLNKFVLKLNHGYGMNIICNNKSKLNINKTKENLIKWKNRIMDL